MSRPVVSVFSAAQFGTFNEFLGFYERDVNVVNPRLKMNLLCLAVSSDKQPDERVKVLRFLLDNGIDVNFTDGIDGQNALSVFYYTIMRPDVDYALTVTKLLTEAGIDLNKQDKYGSTPLVYAITANRLGDKENDAMYRYLIEHGADYNLKNNFDKSALDYAKEYSWRHDFVELVEEYENGRK